MNTFNFCLEFKKQVVPHDAIGSTSKSQAKVVERSADSKAIIDSKKPQAASQMTSESVQKVHPTTISHKQPSEVVSGSECYMRDP